MKADYLFNIPAGIGVLLGITRLTQSCCKAPASAAPAAEQVSAETDDPVARGRYLVRTSGCNDGHTPRFMERGEQVPESE